MIDAKNVHEVLRRHQLVDGYELVIDLERSEGAWVHDGVTGERFLDAFTCFASWPLGYNHPKMREPAFVEELTRAALANVANSDLYTAEMAGFVDAFATHVTPPGFPDHFWISGGALAIENALKASFDWKARKLGRTDFADDVNDLVVMHFHRAFHGRSGYTMSLTNTVPDKVGLFPKFNWPRIHNPAIVFDDQGGIANDIEAEETRACAEIESFLAACPAVGNTLAAIIIEPMQGEGGDNHFRSEFLAKLRAYADEHEAMLIFDEVQTGFYGSGKPWLWQHKGVAPDLVAFGKKSQVCGVYANERIDEIEANVFRRSSRINSTWGGNLADMVRSRRFIEIIEEDGLADHITGMGERTITGLREIAAATNAFTNVRGLGSLIAFTFPTPDARQRMLASLYERGVLALACGDCSVRFRLPLVIAPAEVDELLTRTAAAVGATVGA
jgi:L-lysine 6-transaminase